MAFEDRAVARLREIAAVVGCSIETFFLPRDIDLDSSTTVELFRLWNTLTEPQARQRVLDSARLEASLQDAVRKVGG
ncbi:hypothetical protein ACRAWG_16510 [Methylobacterium sp. P31]